MPSTQFDECFRRDCAFEMQMQFGFGQASNEFELRFGIWHNELRFSC